MIMMAANGNAPSYGRNNDNRLLSTLAGYLRSKPETQIITTEEAKLLELVSTRHANVPWTDATSIASDPARRPSKKKVVATRPSSARSKLRTHPSFETGFLVDDPINENRFRPNTASISTTSDRNPPRMKMRVVGAPRFTAKSAAAPDRRRNHLVEKSSSAKLSRSRRLTLIGCETSSEIELVYRRFQLDSNNRNDRLKRTVEESISIAVLDELRRAFNLADTEGNGTLDFAQFKSVLKAELDLPTSKESQIDALFHKIDLSSTGAITWDEFCTYMQLEYTETDESYKRDRQTEFKMPAITRSMPHREPVLRVVEASADGSLAAASPDGIISFWSPTMTLTKTKSIITKKDYSSGFVPPSEVANQRSKSKWITDFLIMPHYNKVVLGTGDRELQFYELSSFEPYCQVSNLESAPLKLDYCHTGNEDCIISFGDSQGCVNVLMIQSTSECLKIWKQPAKTDGIASVSLEQIIASSKTKFCSWKVHGDWVQQVKYYHDLGQVVSCSNDENTALVIGCTVGSTLVNEQLREIQGSATAPKNVTSAKPRSDADQSVFCIYKGAKCFDFSKSLNVLATGGMDRLVRIWNPYVTSRSTGVLKGHTAPICYLFIAKEDGRLFSISTDLCIRVWNIQDQNCLLVLRPKSHKINGDIQGCLYSPITKTIAIATHCMNALQLKQKSVRTAQVPLTHKDPIHSVIYNSSFKQVITCSDGSVIKLWDFETGSEIFEYGEAHGDAAVTCMVLDDSKRRLISGGRDGRIRVWNYNNGHCLKTLQKEKNNEEICGLSYVCINKSRYVVSVGWDRRLNIYDDTIRDNTPQIQHPLPYWPDDTNKGHVDDILSVSACPPNLLATSSYDGMVVVWNMAQGHTHCHLRPPAPNSCDKDEKSVNKVIFLKAKCFGREKAMLVTGGPGDSVQFWNVYGDDKLIAQFHTSKIVGTVITTMETNADNTVLFTGDNYGFVSEWNIAEYATRDHKEEASPDLMKRWRAHVKNITCMTLVEDEKVLVTSSLDCTVRVWTLSGEYIVCALAVEQQTTACSKERTVVWCQDPTNPRPIPEKQKLRGADPKASWSWCIFTRAAIGLDQSTVDRYIRLGRLFQAYPRVARLNLVMTELSKKHVRFEAIMARCPTVKAIWESSTSIALLVNIHPTGTFGQSESWDIYNADTFQHPMVPYDILVDTLSLPSHPVIAKRERIKDILFDRTATKDNVEPEILPKADSDVSIVAVPETRDETINEMLKSEPFANGTGKRLRHERLKPKKIDHGGPRNYQMLRCYDLDDMPQPTSPRHHRKNREDAFDNFMNDNDSD